MIPIILLHGALGAAKSMLSLCTALDPFAEVHVMDFAGHGESRWPSDGFALERFEQDVMQLLEERDLHQAHIFGYSMGGFVGLRLASQFPDRIKSLTTLATKFDWQPETCTLEASKLDADALESKVPKFTYALSQLHVRNGWRMVVHETRKLLQGMDAYRLSPETIRQIQVPVRLMLGDRDRMVSLEETLAVYRNLPQAELAILPGTAHPLEQVNRELLAFLIRNKLG